MDLSSFIAAAAMTIISYQSQCSLCVWWWLISFCLRVKDFLSSSRCGVCSDECKLHMSSWWYHPVACLHMLFWQCFIQSFLINIVSLHNVTPLFDNCWETPPLNFIVTIFFSCVLLNLLFIFLIFHYFHWQLLSCSVLHL